MIKFNIEVDEQGKHKCRCFINLELWPLPVGEKFCLLVVLGWFVSPCIQCKTSYLKYNKIGRVIQK